MRIALLVDSGFEPFSIVGRGQSASDGDIKKAYLVLVTTFMSPRQTQVRPSSLHPVMSVAGFFVVVISFMNVSIEVLDRWLCDVLN